MLAPSPGSARARKAWTDLVVLVLQFGLGTLGAGTDGFGVVAVKGTAGLGVEELGAVLVVAGDQESDAEGAGHDGLFALGALAESEGQVADGLGARLDAEGLVVVEGVRLGLDAGVLDHGAGIGLEAGHGAADVAVDLDDLLDGRGLEQGGGDALLDAEDDALRGGDADGRGPELDRLEGVFDLEETAFGGESVDSPVCGRSC